MTRIPKFSAADQAAIDLGRDLKAVHGSPIAAPGDAPTNKTKVITLVPNYTALRQNLLVQRAMAAGRWTCNGGVQ